MSVVNSALTKLTQQQKQGAVGLQKAEVPKLKKSSFLVWLLAGFGISLAVGGFAVSQQKTLVGSDSIESVEVTQTPTASSTEVVSLPSVSSPTTQQVQADEVNLFSASKPEVESVKVIPPKVTPKKPESVPRTVLSSQPVVPSKSVESQASTVQSQLIEEPLLIAKVESNVDDEVLGLQAVDADSEAKMSVQKVELTPEQLAQKSIVRAEKALNANDTRTAFFEYHKALELVPSDEKTRQKLSALYYGRKDIRRAVTLLQKGIRLNESSQDLRLALAKLLVKEQQPEAALSSLIYTPDNISEEYLALRAGLAQQVKNVEVAQESYQALVERDPNNARWWLGLAIQQERQLDYTNAKASYTKAIKLAGVSKQTQTFIRDRLKLLNSLEGGS